ncbi:AzlD domain-containing protein [Dendrosporobacter sp. 1207_IL3150]|uniref:AzlD domain-containing protein n=1 Tax=Dendrosporobacter sp. 1207_IL3150 TaxID=3084054 RepID=UPI002FD90BAA
MRTEIMLTIVAMAIATFLTRFTSPALLGNTRLPDWFVRLLKHVPTAMLTALIAPALLAPKGIVEVALTNHYLIAGLVAAYVAYRRQPPIATMGSGMAVMLLLRSISV